MQYKSIFYKISSENLKYHSSQRVLSLYLSEVTGGVGSEKKRMAEKSIRE